MCQTGGQRAKLRTVDLVVGDLVIDCETITHPLLGDAFVICDRAGEPLTAMSAIDFDRPAEIPIIAAPRKLPSGAGSPLINFIAERAHAAGVAALRYAGPYNTNALFYALLRSFRLEREMSTDELKAERVFTDDALRRALAMDRTPIAVDFIPAPHRRVPFADGWSEVRNGAEYAVIDAVVYGGREDLMHPMKDGHAWLDFGGDAKSLVAKFDDAGGLLEGPHPIPRFGADVIGKDFPVALREALAELVAGWLPEPLRPAAAALVVSQTLEWADLGGRAATRTATGFALHAGLWQGSRPKGIASFVAALACALGPILAQTIVAELQPRLPA